jgi:hypothetical protein
MAIDKGSPRRSRPSAEARLRCSIVVPQRSRKATLAIQLHAALGAQQSKARPYAGPLIPNRHRQQGKASRHREGEGAEQRRVQPDLAPHDTGCPLRTSSSALRLAAALAAHPFPLCPSPLPPSSACEPPPGGGGLVPGPLQARLARGGQGSWNQRPYARSGSSWPIRGRPAGASRAGSGPGALVPVRSASSPSSSGPGLSAIPTSTQPPEPWRLSRCAWCYLVPSSRRPRGSAAGIDFGALPVDGS